MLVPSTRCNWHTIEAIGRRCVFLECVMISCLTLCFTLPCRALPLPCLVRYCNLYHDGNDEMTTEKAANVNFTKNKIQVPTLQICVGTSYDAKSSRLIITVWLHSFVFKWNG